MNVKYHQTCRICGNPNLKTVLDLGDQWIQGAFDYPNKTKPPIRKITTKIVRCDTSKQTDSCGLIQNLVSVPPEILYSNYGYRSDVSKSMREHLNYIVQEIQKLIPTNYKHARIFSYDNSKLPVSVCDIGGNNGYTLNCFNKEYRKTLIDPSDLAQEAEQKYPEIKVINKCFPVNCLLTFDAILSLACMYDVDDLNGFCKTIKESLSPFGVWAFEVAYLPLVLERLCYDQFVLEHVSTFSLAVLEKLLAKHELRIFRADVTETNGGSLLGFVCHENYNEFDKPEYKENLKKLRLKEFDLELDTDKPYIEFRNKVNKHTVSIKEILSNLKESGEKIYIYGASTKLNVLLQAAQIGPELIEGAAERDPNKFGAKLLNGIPIVSEEQSRDATVYFVGPWHFRSEICAREKEFVMNGGKLLFALPTIELITKDNYHEFVK